MVAEPRQQVWIQHVAPIRNRPVASEPKQRMLETRVDQAGVFGRRLEPKPLPVPAVQRQPRQVVRPAEPRRRGYVIARDMALRGESGEGVVLALTAAQARQYAPRCFGGAQGVM